VTSVLLSELFYHYLLELTEGMPPKFRLLAGSRYGKLCCLLMLQIAGSFSVGLQHHLCVFATEITSLLVAGRMVVECLRLAICIVSKDGLCNAMSQTNVFVTNSYIACVATAANHIPCR
jgi:hypothetical protein